MPKCALVTPTTVDQHSTASVKDYQHPLPMPDVPDNTLAGALLMRFNRGIDSTVNEYSLFALWCAIDDELTRRKSPELL